MIKLAYFFKYMMTVVALSYAPFVAAQPTEGSSDNYKAANVVQTKPGEILSIQPQNMMTRFRHAGPSFLINYRSRGIHGEPVVNSGLIVLPQGKAPKQGWPVLAWAHGTTGVADTCAPSADYPGGPVNSYQQVADVALDSWLARGYAVVAPDYQGLGTPGMHPYMNATSHVHSVVDAVRAVHRLRPQQVSKQWVVMGHSQGGAAALAVAAYGQNDAPELDLKGAIALAPGGYQYEGIAEYAQTHPQVDRNVAAFFPIVLLGAQAADPKIVPEDLVSPDMQALLNQGRKRCLSELQAELTQAPDSIFRSDVDLKPLLTYLEQQSIERMSPQVPLLIVQGTADQLVDSGGVSTYYQQLCQANKPVVYASIVNGDHREAVRQSSNLSAPFLALIDQGEIPSSCPVTTD